MLFSKRTSATALTVLALAITPAFAQQSSEKHSKENLYFDSLTSEMKEVWTHAKLETAFTLSEHLNPLSMQVKVKGGEVTLTGHVKNEVEYDLATQISKSVQGVTKVNNLLKIKSGDSEKSDHANTFSQKFSDAMISAELKTKLLTNDNISGLDVNVETRNSQVVLKGTVDTKAHSDLIAQIAENIEGVQSVENKLKIVRSS